MGKNNRGRTNQKLKQYTGPLDGLVGTDGQAIHPDCWNFSEGTHRGVEGTMGSSVSPNKIRRQGRRERQ